VKKILSIVGARPQFIKLASLSRQLRERFHEIILHTGQHFDQNMSQLFFKELAIPDPTYHLSIQGGDHGEQTGRMLTGIESILSKEKPDVLRMVKSRFAAWEKRMAEAEPRGPFRNF